MGTPDSNKKGFDIDIIDIPGLETSREEPEPSSPSSLSFSESIASTDLKFDENTQAKIDSIIATLINRMKKKGDFPSFSRQIASVNKILHMNYASAKDIADVITRDFSLSQKLLKLVNSSFYGQFSDQGIASITEAMIILGADCIQQAAASLMLFELMQQSSQTDALKDVTIGNFMSGLIAKELARRKGYRDTETFLIAAMFHNLGQLLILFYFPEKYDQVNRLILQEHLEKNKAAQMIIGVTFWELGIGIAETWGLPGDITLSMRPVIPPIPNKISNKNDILRCFSAFSSTLCESVQNINGLNDSKQIEGLLSQFQGVIDISHEEIKEIVSFVHEKIKEHAVQLNIDIQKSRLFKLFETTGFKAASGVLSESSKRSSLQEQHLAEKIKEISDTINQQNYKIGDVMMTVLDTMEKNFNYTRVAMCIKSLDANKIIVRYALGKDTEFLKKNFTFTISTTSDDIFNAALNEGSDVIINDVTHKKYGNLIPRWYTVLDIATGFSIYPIIVNKVVFGLFYADTDRIDLKQHMRQHDYMKKLRTLTVKAIKNISTA